MTAFPPLPGAGRGPDGGLYAWLLDGSLDSAGARELHPHDIDVLDHTTAIIRIAVRTADGGVAGPATVLTRLRGARDAERAERTARAAAREWHLEDYQFSGWNHLPWSRSRTVRYRLIGVRQVEAQREGRHWSLAAGPPVPDMGGLSVRDRVLQDRWRRALTEIRQAAEIFGRRTGRFAAMPLDPVLDSHRAVVVAALQQAHELADLGRDLSLPAAGALPDDLIKVSERLDECRRVIVTAIRQVSRLHLQVVGHSDPDAVEAAERLHQVGSALAELTNAPTPGS